MPDVPLVALDRAHAPLRAELSAAFERVVDASAFVLGEEVATFESRWAAFCEVEHAVGVASGTAALTLALEALGIGPGDEVIVPAHTFIASALAVIHVGATPVLCDVLADTGLIDAAAAEALVGERTAAIMPVHLYGQACDMEAIGALASRHGIAIVEDAAQAHGARWDGRRCGSLGTIACFSFYPTKNLGALGDGGAVCTGDSELAARVRALRDLGQRRKGEHELAGRNERLDGLQAALLGVKLAHLDAANAARRAHADAYRRAFEGRVVSVAERAESPCVFHLFPVRVSERDAVSGRLAAAGVQTGVHYSPSMPEHAALAGRVLVPHEALNARAWAAEELSLPMFPELTDGERDRVVAASLKAVGAPIAAR
jgi:dTDP-3-amino-3,4,6-trideoxy-alpha-D-glucose transaminase